ncbi:DUF2750 domain-containing protein [Colwelliaceae bacterium 6471]
MSDVVLEKFLTDVKATQSLWALQDKASEDWVVLDSINFENAEAMPVWSQQELAQSHCIDEWENYRPAQISLSEWLEFWVEDLNEDGVIVGVNWPQEGDCLEMELAEFTQAVAAVEKL